MDEKTDKRKFYHRRSQRNQRKGNVKMPEQTKLDCNSEHGVPMHELECMVHYYGVPHSFSICAPTGISVGEISSLVIAGVNFSAEEFKEFGNIILETKNPEIVFIKDELINKISSMRKAMVEQDQMQSIVEHDDAIIQELDELYRVLNLQNPEKETTMTSENIHNIPTLTEVVKPDNSQSSQATSSNPEINQTENTMNSTENNTASSSTATADKAVKPNQDQPQSTASAVAAGATLAASTGLVATKGFIARNKKKLLVAGGVVGLSVGGYFAWQRWGAQILGAGEAVIEQLPTA